MTSIKYLGALATRVIKHESFGNVTPAYITYFKSCSVICTDSVTFIVYLNHKYFIKLVTRISWIWLIVGQFWGYKGQIGQENCNFDIVDFYCFKQIILVLFMVFSDEDLIFLGIHSDTSNLTNIISVFDKKNPWPYIRMIQPFPEFWNISGVTNCVGFPFDRRVCNAVVIYGINTPNAAVCFTLTAHHLNDSLGYWI